MGERLHGMQEVMGSNPGGIAQLGERLHGMQEVMGSNPTISI